MASAVTIGNFDGVHLGHQEIIRTTLQKAGSDGLEPVAFTFRPHPQSVLRPDRAPALLLTYDEKRELLLSHGIQRVVEQPFDPAFAATSPEGFFAQTLVGREKARQIIVGYDFTFGRERTGHLQVLQDLCDRAGVGLTVVAPRRLEQEVVSSSVIRGLLLAGQVRDAARLLGRPFFYQGPVARGDQRGRKLGFPTANLGVGGKLLLPLGVYATWAWVDGEKFPSVTNIGVRPTFADPSGGAASGGPVCETHVLDASGRWSPDGLYSRELRVEFMGRIREEKKFAGLAELSAQIAQDSGSARQILGSV